MEETISLNVEAIDLFCGIGGLTHGVDRTGIKVIAGIDIDDTCRYAYEANNDARFIHKPVEEINSYELSSLYHDGTIKVLMGCAPCQPFSKYAERYNKQGYRDNKWRLLYDFLRLIKDIRPQIVSMENVPKLAKTPVFLDFYNALQEMGYAVSSKIVNCAEYGVPQYRKRLVLLASRIGEICLVQPTHTVDIYETVRSSIGHLPLIADGEQSEDDIMHRACKLSTENRKRIRQSLPGGTWIDWEPSLKAKCHTKKSGETYKSVYGRMEWDKPAPTITTQFYGYGNGRFGHPSQHRAISFREGAILQSFPHSYSFFEGSIRPKNRELGTHIGNAVPVKLGEAIGRSILRCVSNERNGREYRYD